VGSLYQHVKEHRQTPFPFVDDAKIESKIGGIMDIKRAFPTFLRYSLIFSDILRFSLLRAKKKHQNQPDSDAYETNSYSALPIADNTS
jgi:hypothetical protein